MQTNKAMVCDAGWQPKEADGKPVSILLKQGVAVMVAKQSHCELRGELEKPDGIAKTGNV